MNQEFSRTLWLRPPVGLLKTGLKSTAVIVTWYYLTVRLNYYSSPSILQPSILRPLLIIGPHDLVPKGNFLC